MYLITIINRSGHTVSMMNCPLSRSETELILTEQGWTKDPQADGTIWRKLDRKMTLRLEKAIPLPGIEIARKLADLDMD